MSAAMRPLMGAGTGALAGSAAGPYGALAGGALGLLNSFMQGGGQQQSPQAPAPMHGGPTSMMMPMQMSPMGGMGQMGPMSSLAGGMGGLPQLLQMLGMGGQL